jgi:acetyl esterase/lipase
LDFLWARSRDRGPSERDLIARRHELDAFGSMDSVPEGVTTTTVDAGGVPAVLLVPPGGRRDRMVLYLHGGGYCRGSIRSHSGFAGRLSVALGASVLLIEYRLAPEHPFPAALDDALDAYRWATGPGGVRPEAVAVAGDSAGGGLALAALVSLRDTGAAVPACGALISPWVDLRVTETAEQTELARDPVVSLADLELSAAWYLGEDRADHPLASPLLADLSGLPPLLVHVGTEEILLREAIALDAAARTAGTSVELTVAPDMVHCWHLFPGLPEAEDGVAEIGRFVNRQWAGAPEGLHR